MFSVFSVVSVLDFGYSHRYVVISYCRFNLHFPDDIWSIFSFACLSPGLSS